jgi:hypothetical protein
MTGFGQRMWLIIALTLQFMMCITIAPVQYWRVGQTTIMGTVAISVQLAAWVYLLILVVLCPSVEDQTHHARLTAGNAIFVSVLVLAICTFASTAISLVACAADDAAFCHAAYFFGDAFFLAWWFVNVFVQLGTVAIFRYWTGARPRRSIPHPSRGGPALRMQTLLFVGATALGLTWLVYMLPMFYSAHAEAELVTTLFVGMTVALLIAESIAGIIVDRISTIAIQLIPILSQTLLLFVRIGYLISCRAASTDTRCWYTLPQVDVMMIVANVIVVLFLGGALALTLKVIPAQ